VVVKYGGYAIYSGTAAIFGGVLFIYIFLIKIGHGASLCISGVPRGAFLLGHVASTDFSHLCADVTSGHVAPSGWCHVASPGGAMWHFFTGPHGALKSPNLSDMWQPLVLPRGMTS
jgi:hypothetical protein